MSRLTVLVDMDGVIANFSGYVATVWNRRYPDKPALSQDELFNWRFDQDYANKYGEEASKIVIDMYQGPDFFAHLEPIPGHWKR